MATRYNDGFADYNQVHAQAQAIADVRDDAAEEDRRRRVKEENLAAFDAAREQGRSGRSMITASAFDGDGMRRDYMGGRLVGEMPLDSQGAIAAEFTDLANRSTAAKRHNAQIESDSLNSAMMAARRNGGMLPQNAVDMLSRKLGLDGKNSAVFRAGYLDNGDFDIDIVTRGQNGGLQRRTKKISPLEQYNLMLGAPGVWGAEGQAVADGLYQRLRGTRGKSELAAPSTYGQNLSAYQDGQRTKQEMQAGIELLKLAKEFSGDGKGGEQALIRAVVGSKGFVNILARGGKIYVDKDGNEVEDPYESDGKTLRKDVTAKLDDEGNPMYREDADLAFQRIHKAWEKANAGNAGGTGGGLEQEILKRFDAIMAPRRLSPEEAEIQQRQRQNALDDQRRSDLMRGRKERLIHWRDANGALKVGSGYIVDGKVYDNQGYEISGATPMQSLVQSTGRKDANGREVLETVYEEMPKPAPAQTALPQTPAKLDGRDVQAVEALRQHGGPTVEAAAQMNGTPAQSANDGQAPAQAAQQPPPDGEFVTRYNRLFQWRNGDQGWKYYPAQNDAAKTKQESAKTKKEPRQKKPKSAEQMRLETEARRITKFRTLGGIYDENEDGAMEVRIANFDYLPDEDKKALGGEDTFDYLDENLIAYQQKANEAAKELEVRRRKKIDELRDQAAVNPRLNNATKRRKWVDESMKNWDIDNDPVARAKRIEETTNFGSGPMSLF